MNDAKYIGMDVHQATISVAVRDSRGNLVMEAILETKAETILQFVRGLGGSLHVTFEEGTWAAWLYDLLKPHVTKVVVCDPRKNPLLRVGNHNDREDARKLSELLYLNKLSSVFHGETGIRTLRELARSYLTITRDLTRVMNRLKAIYRGWGIACTPEAPYRLAVPARGYRHVVGFVADVNASGVGVDHFQAEVFTLHLAHHLPSLLAVHLVPMVLRWMVGCSFAFLLCLGFHASLPMSNSTWLGPVGETSQSPQRGRAVLLFRTTPATIYTIAKAGAMLLIGQERSTENGGLSCRATSCLRF